MSTKKQREKIVAEKLANEHNRILYILNESDYYDITLDPAIETYLEIFEIYQSKYVEWKDRGFPTVQKITNKNGSTNSMKHPLAHQVEVWTDKKMKALAMLGLVNKKIQGKFVGGKPLGEEEIKRPNSKEIDYLRQHQEKWREGGDAN